MEHDARVVHHHIELGKACFHQLRERRDLRWICDIALDGVEFRILRLDLIQHGLPSTSHDDLVAEFEEFERESEADTCGAAGDQNGAISNIHRSPFMRHRIMTIIQRSQKKSEAVQKMISYARQDSLLVGRLREDAGNGYRTRHRAKNDEEVSLSLGRSPSRHEVHPPVLAFFDQA